MKSCPLPHALDNLTATLRICVNSRLALSAGVQTTRARICSAISCDMFARVVWLKPWSGKIAGFRFILCRTHLTRMARATNSCTREDFSKRGERSL